MLKSLFIRIILIIVIISSISSIWHQVSIILSARQTLTDLKAKISRLELQNTLLEKAIGQ